MNLATVATLALVVPMLAACGQTARLTVAEGTGPQPRLVAPGPTLMPTVNIARARGWPVGVTPQAAAGTRVTALGTGLDHPRWLMVLPDGDVLVAETNAPARPDEGNGLWDFVMGLVMKRAGAAVPSADRITLLRDSQGTGVADVRSVLLEGQGAPSGMVLVGTDLYVAYTDAILRFPYSPGQTRIGVAGVVVATLPAGVINHPWTKNLIASADGRKLYVTVGSNSNVAERGMAAEAERAAVWEVDISTGAHRVYASGMRNPDGTAWTPGGALWTVVKERDELGSDFVPDYLTAVHDGVFCGGPYGYFGNHVDDRIPPQRPELVATASWPDCALGLHTASLGLAASVGNALPPRSATGMFIGPNGAWNRRPHSGYRVVFVPFRDSQPTGASPLDVLTGFLEGRGNAYGRPQGVAVDRRGGLLVADAKGNLVRRVTAAP